MLAYVDESGDDGVKRGSSKSYALGCVMLDSSSWAATFDQIIAFRRYVRREFGIPVRAELKANYLLHNRGPLLGKRMSEHARFKVYRAHMRLQEKLGLESFAVVIDKTEARERHAGSRPASDIAWEYLLQRLERSFRNTEVLVVHDEGDATTIRKRARKARRAGTAGSQFGTGQLNTPFRNLLDDPVPRDSKQSYFLQLADLNAYAAFRNLYPPPSNRGVVVPENIWNELGEARSARVRDVARWGGTRGIVPGP